MLFSLIFTSRLFSMDLKLIGGFGNLSFDNDRTTAISAEAGKFEPVFFPLALAQLSGDFNNLSCSVGFEREPLMRNRLFANIRADLEYFYIEAGPTLGLFNSSKLPLSPGISAGLGLIIPGIIFIEAGGSSTLGILMDVTDNYFQRSGALSAGFWAPYVVCSLNISTSSFTCREQVNLLIEDELARYFFRADVYTKNIPFTIRVDLGFQNLSRSYVSQIINGDVIENDTEKDVFKSIFMGLEGTYTFSPELKFLLGGEIPVHSWGVRPMKEPSRSTFFFQVWTGVIWTLPSGKYQRN